MISIIIPAFKQEKTITRNIRQVDKALRGIGYEYEIVVVVDGTVDATLREGKKLASKRIKVVGYDTNKGKGYAIRYGMVRSRGSIVGFVDAGMELNPKGLLVLLEYLEQYHMDIVVGSKRHKDSKVIYPVDRKVLSILSQLFIRLLFGLNVKDTQVGMKLFRREVLEDVLPRLLVKRFAFDIEMLVVAFHLGYKKVGEVPVEINFKFPQSVVSQNLFRVVLRTFWDTVAIFYRLKILRYYDNASKRKWKFDPELNLRINIG